MPTTKLLVLSDTHDQHDNIGELPPVDVIIHCGDLTQIGGLSNYRRAIQYLSRSNAELKLVIAGNHDISLDKSL